jgi:Raf kinase inhibitor-like YbhB/YbcL family protein
MGMTLTCPAFANGEPIQSQFTCSGKNCSPELEWSSLPAGTRSLALILEDPDAPGGTFYHWVLYAIEPAIGKLPGDLPKTLVINPYGRQGTNSFGRPGYDGPCPPPGKTHRYYLFLFALDAILPLNAGLDTLEVKSAMRGHILDQAETYGIFKRSSSP